MVQSETGDVFALIISEIATQKVKISSTSKNGDKSDIEFMKLKISDINGVGVCLDMGKNPTILFLNRSFLLKCPAGPN